MGHGQVAQASSDHVQVPEEVWLLPVAIF